MSLFRGPSRLFFSCHLALVTFLLSSNFQQVNATASTRSFKFEIEERYARLATSLPDHTSIFNKWPHEELRTHLPDYLSVAVMTSQSTHISDSSYIFMGMPIHVVEYDQLDMAVLNNLQSTGLSIHFHGFEMANAIEYDGVVGLTQCAIPPRHQFRYNFTVEEKEGLYWYHTHSGNLGVDSHNVIKAPLIVHPDTPESRALVDKLYDIAMEDDHVGGNIDYRPLLSYGKERILFISDGFLKSEAMIEMYSIGGLNPPVQANDDGFVAGTMEHQFGTINGKLRDVIHVVKGETYTFRLLNGGSHFAYRISIDGFQMKIVAADSSPVDPYEVDEVILHNGERFDVEITIPDTLNPLDSFWIRADTQEARKHGYENGIRAILNIVDTMEEANILDDHIVMDPRADIRKAKTSVVKYVTMNCYSKLETVKAAERKKGGCLPITKLRARDIDHKHRYMLESSNNNVSTTVRTVDFDVRGTPMHAHFSRVEYGNWYQFVGSSTHMLRPDFETDRDLHPHTSIMDVPAFSPVIIVWRSKSLMDYPMHLHGYKMEILEVFAADRVADCTLAKCEISNIFNSTEKIEELKNIPMGSRPIKDTFIMPAGGAVATRIFTREPAPWLAHCHMEVHREDGMAFVLNVGNYYAPSNGSWLPDDFPNCETPFHKSQHEEPHCDCYIDKDAVLGLTMDSTYKCSRPYTCMWEQSQVAALKRHEHLGNTGFRIQSTHPFPGWAISLIIVGVAALITFLFMFVIPRCTTRAKSTLVKESGISNRDRASMKPITSDSEVTVTFWDQFKGLVILQWHEYRPGVVNILRVVEVAGLGILAGILFYDVGNNSTATGFAEKTSLIFFSTTLWSQTRMYPAIGNYHEWAKVDFVTLKYKQYDVLPICLSRMLVVYTCEAWWPLLFVLCAFPLAYLFGSISTVLTIGGILILNNSCYISLGGLFGTLMPTISLGMIGATLFAQTTVICAGFFTALPKSVGWIRYISPIYYAFRGIVKSAYNWDDTYQCIKGQSAVGPNDCFLEKSAAIDDYKQRGINVATFGDPTSSQIHTDVIMLIVLFTTCQILILLYQFFFIRWKISKSSKNYGAAGFDVDLINLKRNSVFITINDNTSVERQASRNEHLISTFNNTTKPNKGNTAIILIDFQNEFAKEGGKLYNDVKDMIKLNGMLTKVPKLLTTARESDTMVIFAPVVMKAEGNFSEEDFDPHSYLAMSGLFTEGTWNSNIIQELEPKSNEIVLENRTNFSAFQGTGLASVLKKNGITRVFFGGFLTNVCIEETIREMSLLCPEISMYALSDGCASKSVKEHEQSTQHTFPMFDAKCVTCAEASSML